MIASNPRFRFWNQNIRNIFERIFQKKDKKTKRAWIAAHTTPARAQFSFRGVWHGSSREAPLEEPELFWRRSHKLWLCQNGFDSLLFIKNNFSRKTFGSLEGKAGRPTSESTSSTRLMKWSASVPCWRQPSQADKMRCDTQQVRNTAMAFWPCANCRV